MRAFWPITVLLLLSALPLRAQEPEVQEPVLPQAYSTDAAEAFETRQDEKLMELDQRVERLEQAVKDQGELLQAAQSREAALRQALQEQAQVAEQSGPKAVEQRQAQEDEARKARAAQLEDAQAKLEAANELVEAGSRDVDDYLTDAANDLQAAAQLASQYGTPNETAQLEEAQRLLGHVWGLLQTRNLLDAQVALDAAAAHAAQARALAEAPATAVR